MNNPLKKELSKFREVQTELLADNPNGGYAVIKGNELMGVWKDRSDAIRIGVEKFGNTTFLVKNIRDEDRVVNFSRSLEFA